MADFSGYDIVANPKDTVGLPARPIAGPTPLQPNAGPAPLPLEIAANAPRVIGQQSGGDLEAIAKSFAGLSPGIDKAIGSYYEAQNAEDKKTADYDATQSALKSNIKDWGAAVAADPSLADKSPWYRQVYEARLATSAVEKQSGQVMANYYNSPIAGSNDPSAIQPWLQKQYAGVLDQFTSPAAKAAAADQLRKDSELFIAAHQKNAATNLVQNNQDSFQSALGLSLDRWAATDGKNLGALQQSWQTIQDQAKLQGMTGRDINTEAAKALSTGMIRLGRSDLAALGTSPRPDGTPGFATTNTGRAELVAANDHLFNRQTSLESRAWTAEQRARMTSDRTAEGDLTTLLLTRTANGQDPQLTPQEMLPYARNPEVVTKLLTMQKSLRAASIEEDPRKSALIDAPFYQGTGTVQDVSNLAAQGQISPEHAVRLMTKAQENANNDGLTAPGVTAVIKQTSDIVGQVAEISGVMEQPIAGAAAANMMREEALNFRKNNPTASAADQVLNLQKKSPEIIKSLRPAFDLSPLAKTVSGAPGSQAGASDQLWGAVKGLGENSKMGDVSPKGAIGTSQIMPATAAGVETSLGLPHDPDRVAKDPAYNDMLGRTYLGQMMDRYRGNKTLAVAAYNAGPGAVDGWLTTIGDPRTAAISTADWTARIPLDETRAYVGRVLGGGNVQSTAPTAAPVPAPAAPPMKPAPAPQAGLDWKQAPAFNDRKGLEDAITQEVKGGGSPVLRQWFSKLGLVTPEAQRAFIGEQRRVLSTSR